MISIEISASGDEPDAMEKGEEAFSASSFTCGPFAPHCCGKQEKYGKGFSAFSGKIKPRVLQ